MAKDTTSPIPVFLTKAEMPALDSWVTKLDGWMPETLNGYGDSCLVFLNDSRMYLGGKPSQWWRKVADFYLISRRSTRRRYIQYVGKRENSPLAIAARETVFFAVRYRTANYPKAEVYGYLSNQAIDEMRSVSHNVTRVTLKSGYTVDVRMTLKSLKNARQNADYFQMCLQRDKATAPTTSNQTTPNT